jgi:hypothetical protein
MKVRSIRRRHWGTLVWVLVFGFIVLVGLPESLMRVWVHKVTEPGPRSATDSMIFRNVGLHDGTAKLRELLANTAPPKPGRTYVVRLRWEEEYEEVALAIALLAWPDDVKFVIFDKDELFRAVPASGSSAPARVFYLGRRPNEEVPGLRAIGDRMWFKPGNVTP